MTTSKRNPLENSRSAEVHSTFCKKWILFEMFSILLLSAYFLIFYIPKTLCYGTRQKNHWKNLVVTWFHLVKMASCQWKKKVVGGWKFLSLSVKEESCRRMGILKLSKNRSFAPCKSCSRSGVCVDPFPIWRQYFVLWIIYKKLLWNIAAMCVCVGFFYLTH